jgi:hypothetical protein
VTITLVVTGMSHPAVRMSHHVMKAMTHLTMMTHPPSRKAGVAAAAAARVSAGKAAAEAKAAAAAGAVPEKGVEVRERARKRERQAVVGRPSAVGRVASVEAAARKVVAGEAGSAQSTTGRSGSGVKLCWCITESNLLSFARSGACLKQETLDFWCNSSLMCILWLRCVLAC